MEETMISISRLPWNRIEHDDTYQNILFEEINTDYVEKLIESTGIITDITKPQTTIEKARYSCNNCYELSEYDRILSDNELSKTQCRWCDHKGTLYPYKATYKDIQHLTIGFKNTSKTVNLFLEDKLVSHDKYQIHDTIKFKGLLRPVNKNNKVKLIVQCRDVEIISRLEDIPEQKEENDRSSPQYTKWVNDIHARDKVCQICGGNKHLEAHHIYAYKNNPELRTDIGNGVLLCTFCHNKFHSYYGKDVTPADLVKFIFEFKGL